jgi:hypothetical protein
MEKQVADKTPITYPEYVKKIAGKQTPAQKLELKLRTERTKKIIESLKRKNELTQ